MPSTTVPQTRSSAFWQGVRCASGTPAAVLFAGMVGFGATGHQNGFPVELLSLCSLLMFALPGQIVMLEMLAGGSAWLAIVLAVTLTSSRFVTMAVTLFPQLHPRDRGRKLHAATHLMAMTSWALSMRDFVHIPRRHRFSYYMGVGTWHLFGLSDGRHGAHTREFGLGVSEPFVFLADLHRCQTHPVSIGHRDGLCVGPSFLSLAP